MVGFGKTHTYSLTFLIEIHPFGKTLLRPDVPIFSSNISVGSSLGFHAQLTSQPTLLDEDRPFCGINFDLYINGGKKKTLILHPCFLCLVIGLHYPCPPGFPTAQKIHWPPQIRCFFCLSVSPGGTTAQCITEVRSPGGTWKFIFLFIFFSFFSFSMILSVVTSLELNVVEFILSTLSKSDTEFQNVNCFLNIQK